MHPLLPLSVATASVLHKLCGPAAEEFGLYFRDKVLELRKRNFEKYMQRTQQRVIENVLLEGHHAAPRIATAIFDEASWVDDATLHDLWAGLLVSSCTETGDDDSNLIFVTILRDLTKLQARILKYSCEKCEKRAFRRGLVQSGHTFAIPVEKLCEIVEETDIHRLDREIDRLRATGLLEDQSGFDVYDQTIVYLTPTALALHMYVRCQGSRLTPAEFFNVVVPYAEEDKPLSSSVKRDNGPT